MTKRTDGLCCFCAKRPASGDNDFGLCSPCFDYHKYQGPSGGRAAGAAFELEEEPEILAMGVGK